MWVKLHRSIMDSPVWGDPWLFQLFSWCILRANYQDASVRGVELSRGQFITGKHMASAELGVTISKWYRGMTKLEAMGCISVKSKPRFTIVSVCNYETYQSCESPKRNPDETEVKPKRNPSETEVNPDKELKELTEETETLRVAGNADGDAGKRKKKRAVVVTPEFEAFWNLYPTRKGIRRGKEPAFLEWKRIPAEDIPLVMVAVKAYRVSDEAIRDFARDAERFLKQNWWRAYLEKAGPPPSAYGEIEPLRRAE